MNEQGIVGATADNVVGIVGATVGIGQYIINDYVITIAPIEGDYGYTMTITRGSETQTVTLYGLSTEQYDAMLGYLQQAQEAAQNAAGSASDAADYMDVALDAANRANSKAASAEQSSNTARGYATQAETAKQGAETAKTDAIAAKDIAVNMQRNAEFFATRAETAATNAGNAQTAAEAAQTSAESAQSAAETAAEQVTGMSAEAETLEPGSPATASYADGVLSLGIPQGEHGESGVYVGKTEPSDPDVNVWIDPDGDDTINAEDVAYDETAVYADGTVGAGLADVNSQINVIEGQNVLDIKTAISANLIDMSRFTVIGQYYANDSGATGNHTDNESYISYDALIEVKPSTKYVLSDVYRTLLTVVSLLMIDESGTRYLGGGYNQSGEFTTTASTKYLRISISKTRYNLGEVMLEEGDTISPVYIPYSAPYDYSRTLDQTHDIVCWGDSLTYGTGASSQAKSYPNVLAKLTGRKVWSCAFPGDTSIEIAGMQGAIPMMVKAPFTIPASGSVNIEIYDALLSEDTPFRFPSIDAMAGINPVTIGGIKGNIDFSASGNPDSRIFSFTRLESGTAKSFTWWEPIITNCSIDRKNDIAVIWVGTNGGWESNIQTLANQVKQMSEYLQAVNPKYLIVGLTGGTAQSRATMESLFANVFGGHYINARAYLSEQAIYDQGITPTENDLTQMSEGRVPESLRYDATHLNDYGYDAVANLVYNRGLALEYWMR